MTARDDLNKQVQEYLRIAYEGKWVILSIFIVVVTATWLYTMVQDDIFRAGVSVRLKPSKDLLNSNVGAGGLEGLGWAGERIIANEILMVQSTAISERVADMLLLQTPMPATAMDTLPVLKAAGRPSTMRKLARVLGLEDFVVSLGFAKEDTSRRVSDRGLIAARARSQMAAEPVRGVDYLEISVTSTSPVEAAVLANLYVDAYQQRNLESARQNITTARQFLGAQLETKRDSLVQAENTVRGFQESQGIVSLDAETQNLIQQLSTFEAEREQSRIELQSEEQVRSELRAQLGEAEPRLAQQLKSGVDPRLKQLLDDKFRLEAQITKAEFNKRDMIAKRPELEPFANKDISDLQKKYEEVNKQIESLSQSYTGSTDVTGAPVEYSRELRQKILQQDIAIEATKARIRTLDKTIRDYNSQFDQIPTQAIEFARLERRRQSYDKLFALLDDKYQEALINEQTTLGNVDIIDRAKVPGGPVRPNRPMNMILGILIGLGLGFGVAVLLRYLDTTIRNPEDVEKLGMPVLTFIPTFGSNGTTDRKESLITITAPQSPPSEAYRTMRTAIENSLPDHGSSKAVVLTSPAPKEGKSTAIANLAVSAANSGRKVLLVDADLRRPVQHTIFDLEREPGLTNALIGEVPVRDCIRKTSIPGLHLIPCGHIPSHPAELLGSSKMDRFVQLVRQYYDLVLFDAPPVIAMADTLVLAKYTDGAVIIVSADQTKTLGLQKANEMLVSNQAKILGVVVNRFNANKIYYSYYRYYYQNYYYYSSDGEKKKRRIRKKKGSGADESVA